MAKLTAAEIRKLIKAHNVLTKITIPKGATRDDLIKLVEKKGYTVNHESKLITRKIGKKTETITLEGAKAIAKPKPLTEEQKKKRQQAKQKRAGEKAFLKKAIPAPPPVSKPSKGVKVGKPPPKKVAPPPKVKKVIKEDEVRPARKAAPPIPRARDFVKIGKKPEGRIDTGGPRNVGIVDNTKPKKKEKKKFVPKTEKAKKLREDILARKKPEGRIDTGGPRNVGKVDTTKPKKPKKPKKKEKAKEEPKKGEPRMKGGLISMIMESEGEAKTILENILKKYNSLTVR
jgi:hypothetical protein